MFAVLRLHLRLRPGPASPPARALAALVLAVLVAGGCGGGGPESTPPSTSVPPGYADSLRAFRARVDAYFTSPDGPLTEAQRDAFSGLHYFPPDSSWRFLARPDTAGAGDPVTILDTQGNQRHYRTAARFHLIRRGTRFTITAYRSEAGDYLFLPFQDATTGKETYSVGRYLELPEPEGGETVIDFNYAKNPYCAYNDRWACPLVPEANRLEVAIDAGERKFHD